LKNTGGLALRRRPLPADRRPAGDDAAPLPRQSGHADGADRHRGRVPDDSNAEHCHTHCISGDIMNFGSEVDSLKELASLKSDDDHERALSGLMDSGQTTV